MTSVSPARAPDANGWYNHAVALTFAGSDATSGIASCGAPTYSGPDSGSASVAGVCQDVAGNTSAPLATHSSTMPRRRQPARPSGEARMQMVGTRSRSPSPSRAAMRPWGSRRARPPPPTAARTPPPRASPATARTLPATAPLRRRRFLTTPRRRVSSPSRTGRPTRTAGIRSRSPSPSRATTRVSASHRARPRSATNAPTAPTSRPRERVGTRPGT